MSSSSVSSAGVCAFFNASYLYLSSDVFAEEFPLDSESDKVPFIDVIDTKLHPEQSETDESLFSIFLFLSSSSSSN